MSKLLDIVTSPWAIQPDKLREIRAIYETHIKGEKIDLNVARQQTGLPLENKEQGYEIIDGVAVVPVMGVIAKRMNLFHAISGGASTELIGRDIRDALADPRVSSIILHIDSPGGTVDGTPALAALVREAAMQKTVVGFADGLMASAAYWIGSAASAIYIDGPTTAVGSIGVVASHVDISQAEAKQGIKTTEISSGRYKRIDSGYAPLSEEGREYIQEQTDYLYSIFVDTVAKNRGVSVETVLANMADGKLFIGQQAIDAGLVDGVSTLEALVVSLAAGRKPTSTPAGVAGPTKPNQSSKGNSMYQIITRDYIVANHPEIADALRAEGYSQGRSEGMADGATAERARILDIEQYAGPGHEKLIAALKADGKTTGTEAAAQILLADRAKGGQMLAAFAADAPAAVPAAIAPDAGSTAVDPNLSIEDRCKAGWDKDAKIRSEFGTFAAYLGFEKASASGRVRILGKKG